ncbi:hypothetical protein [Pseudomonas sp. 10S4]|uniref:hypothetical protein n=1 Tax=Pseudomonas sp. 10S4 TaxID=3048583 RepID=UPI002AC939CB|nr:MULTISPECIES: hypothetical protein [unclassified Pseudomonas]MEB0226306.1 hypothetical protein [Pseudomonas sp. 5S1]MEB0298261.1 hypothetical protein [Pseudomonas sp. 10S4]WPX18179.1 hypothetical protein RHM58_31285 [Pseudomonas sp. 10S4]
MPTENKSVEPNFDLNTPDGGRGYIDNLFKTVLKRHDYRQYINERLAGDFACTLAQHLESVKAREQALQLQLNAADQRIDERAAKHHSEDPLGMVEPVPIISFPRELSDDLAELIAGKARVCGGGAFDIWEAICDQFGTPAAQRQDEPVVDEAERQKLIAYGRSCGLDEASTMCSRMAYNIYYPAGSRFKYFVPKMQGQLGDLLIKAANAIASLPGGPYDRFKASQQKKAEKSAAA